MPATLSDIAKRVGVSLTSVSAVLGNRSDRSRVRVSETTRQKILAAARDLGYIGNVHAAALRRGTTQLLGLLVGFSTISAVTERSRAVHAAAWERGYRVLSYDGAMGETDRDVARIRDLLSRRIDGLILSQIIVGQEEAFLEVIPPRYPFVTLWCGHSFRGNAVTVDNYLGGRLAVEHLTSLGRRRPAFLAAGVETGSPFDRCQGWRLACEQAGIDFDQRPHLWFETWPIPEPAQAYHAIREMLRPGSDIDALVCSNDFLALTAMRAMQETGMRIPDDIAMIGFDDEAFAPLLPVPLTSIRQPGEALGRLAVDRLLSLIDDPGQEPEQVAVKPSLVVRTSTAGRDAPPNPMVGE